MALEISESKRVFKFTHDGEDMELSDPNPQLSVEEVKKFYAGKYPELTNANIDGPKIQNDVSVYTLTSAIGKKG